MFEQSKPIFGLVKLTPYYEVHIYTQGKIFVEDDISAYEYSKIRVRKCSALSHALLTSQQRGVGGGQEIDGQCITCRRS